jgi:hypothetical protein
MDKELILAALKKAGLSEDLIDQITATSDDELATQIAALKEKAAKPTLASILKDAGLDEDLEKQIKATVGEMIQSETDRRVTAAIEKVTKKMSKGNPNEADDPKIGELEKKIDALTEALTGQQKKAEQDRLRTLASAALEKKGLPKTWVGRVTVEKEEEIESMVTTLEKEFNEIKQSTVDEVLKQHPIPGLSLGTTGDVTKSKIEQFAKNLVNEEKQTNVVKLPE